MRIAIALAAITLTGCSSLLGITDPTPSDAGSDTSVPTGDRLELNVRDLRALQQQVVRLRVQRILVSGEREDATQRVAYATDNEAVVSLGPAGTFTMGEPGTATITASLAGAEATKLTITVIDELCHLVINELTTGSSSGASDEWVELYNPCNFPRVVDGWTLVYQAANAGGEVALATLTGMVPAGDYRLYAGAQYTGAATPDGRWAGTSGTLQQMTGAVALRGDAGRVDSIAYGGVVANHPMIEGAPTAMMANNLSASRVPYDGKDTNNGAMDFMIIQTPTPRAANAL